MIQLVSSSTSKMTFGIKGAHMAFRTILSQDGYRGLYRGMTANLAGSTISWGLYFWWCVFTFIYIAQITTSLIISEGIRLLKIK